jgi:outer membrane receptor for ferrienterochelin and colicins
LYGAAALGGVINLVSRRPDGERELLLNATTRAGYDAVLWAASQPDQRVGWTLLAGGHTQARTDITGDDWADIPGYDRLLLRPRAFIDGGRWNAMATVGVMTEQRTGGLHDVAEQDAVDTDRLDAGVVAGTWVGAVRLAGRASALRQRHERRFAGRRERDELRTGFAELAASGARGRHTWVLGAALQHEDYRNDDVAGFDERLTMPSVFAQDEWRPRDDVALSASARLDYAGDFGALVSPRLSMLLRPGDWSLRVSAGGGHHLPKHWIDEVHAIGLGALAAPSDLRVERARSLSVDVGREIGEVEVNVTAFGSHIVDALALRMTGAGPVVANVPGSTRTRGGEVLVGAHFDPVHVRLSWTHVRATEPDPAGGRRQVELTPGHAAGFLAMWEPDDTPARVGFELYYTGAQVLRDNPWRDRSRAYAVFGVLAERQFGAVRLFINFENIGNVRQTAWDPLLLPQRAADGRRTTEAWAPLDGRVINGGVRLAF